MSQSPTCSFQLVCSACWEDSFWVTWYDQHGFPSLVSVLILIAKWTCKTASLNNKGDGKLKWVICQSKTPEQNWSSWKLLFPFWDRTEFDFLCDGIILLYYRITLAALNWKKITTFQLNKLHFNSLYLFWNNFRLVAHRFDYHSNSFPCKY